jgi:branched-chain amino acid transport system ATP-binding protein
MSRADTPLLRVSDLVSGYGHVRVLESVDVEVHLGEVVTIIGSNGAGKSTLLKTIVGLVRRWSGAIELDGEEIGGITPDRAVRRGVSLVPEGRLLFGPMTVEENLVLGAYSRSGRAAAQQVAEDRRLVDRLFPVLAERATQPAATLSGGEQQMLAVGRALMSHPRLLLLDEPSLGLAPKVVSEIFVALGSLRELGMTIVLVEQDVQVALEHADRGYVMRTGRVELTGTAAELLANDSVRHIYLGALHGEDEGDAT